MAEQLSTPVVCNRPDLVSNELMAHFSEVYDSTNVAALQNVQQIGLPHRTDSQLDFVRFGDGNAYFIPGFSEGITSKAVFGLALVETVELETGAVVIRPESKEDHLIQSELPVVGLVVPDQNRDGLDMNLSSFTDAARAKTDATYTQALNYVELIEQTMRNDGEPLTIITHSYGSIVFDAMVKIAKERKLDMFNGANVVLMAPAGLDRKDSLVKLGGRFVHYMASELFSFKAFKDTTGEMQKAAIKVLLSNIKRTMKEVGDLASRRISITELLETVGSVAAVGYGKDKMFTKRQLKSVVEDGATYLVPVSFDKRDKKGKLFKRQSRRGATHNDEQFNPSRVANAVRQYLDTVKKSVGGETHFLQDKQATSTDDLE